MLLQLLLLVRLPLPVLLRPNPEAASPSTNVFPHLRTLKSKNLRVLWHLPSPPGEEKTVTTQGQTLFPSTPNNLRRPPPNVPKSSKIVTISPKCNWPHTC